MRARIYSKTQETYYISEVYGIVNRAGNWYIVDDIEEPNMLVLVQYLNFEGSLRRNVNVEIIDCNPIAVGSWIYIDKAHMDKISSGQYPPLCYYRGYKRLWENAHGLLDLLENGTARKNIFGLGNISTKLAGWNYIESVADITYLMEKYSGFEDAILKELSYISGEYIDNEGIMHESPVGQKQIRLLFNSDWADEIEIVLLSPRICQLMPGEENASSVLYGASIFIRDCAVYFYNSYINDVTNDYNGNWFKALGMMWRYVK